MECHISRLSLRDIFRAVIQGEPKPDAGYEREKAEFWGAQAFVVCV
jgi:hypothetical protein